MGNVIPFEYEDGKFEALEKADGSFWFIAKQICLYSGLGNVSMAVSGLDDDERGIRVFDTPGGPQEMITISESGLYTLLIRSNKPEAKKFRRWVTHEVLPAIRKTGAYAMPGREKIGSLFKSPKMTFANLAREVKGAILVGKTYGLNVNQARLYANSVIQEQYGVDCMETMGMSVNMDPQSLRQDAMDMLMDLAECRLTLKTDDGKTRATVSQVLSGENAWQHTDALQPYGLKVTEDGLFFHPATVQRGLLHGTNWEHEDLRKLLLALPDASSRQLRVNGSPVRGVMVPLSVELKSVMPIPEVIQ